MCSWGLSAEASYVSFAIVTVMLLLPEHSKKRFE